jgi:hypothetical protein
MNPNAQTLRSLPLEPFDRPEPGDAWDRSPLADFSDARLVAAVVAAITPPKVAAPSSFVLHAPLELLARAALLPHVAPDARGLARRQIAAVAVRYAHAGAELDVPDGAFQGEASALAALLDALRGGDAQGADSALCFLLPRVPLSRLRAALIDEIVPCLGAAAHAPILLAALPRVADRIAGVGGLLRAPLRTLAVASSQRLRWHLDAVPPAAPTSAPADPAQALFQALAAPPRVSAPSTSIAPTMLAVEQHGFAAAHLAGPARALSPAQAERVLLRVAAQSMLQDDPARAPYGWSHCLTLPQAVLANADAAGNPAALVAVAATHVLGFRATLGTVALEPGTVPAVPRSGSSIAPGALLRRPDTAPTTAAGVAFHAPAHTRDELMTALATRAALHPDAHLAKYTLACFDAAARDAEAAPLFLAAAAYLGAWWDHNDAQQAVR